MNHGVTRVKKCRLNRGKPIFRKITRSAKRRKRRENFASASIYILEAEIQDPILMIGELQINPEGA